MCDITIGILHQKNRPHLSRASGRPPITSSDLSASGIYLLSSHPILLRSSLSLFCLSLWPPQINARVNMECEGTALRFLDQCHVNRPRNLKLARSSSKNPTAKELVSFDDDVSLVTSLQVLLLLRHHNLHPISIPSGLFG